LYLSLIIFPQVFPTFFGVMATPALPFAGASPRDEYGAFAFTPSAFRLRRDTQQALHFALASEAKVVTLEVTAGSVFRRSFCSSTEIAPAQISC
jgi:hypothetical protein